MSTGISQPFCKILQKGWIIPIYVNRKIFLLLQSSLKKTAPTYPGLVHLLNLALDPVQTLELT